MSTYEPPVVTVIGNMRDLLAMVCAPHEEEEVRVAGWILEFERGGWKIRVQPLFYVGRGPYQVSVTSPAGVQTKVKRGCPTVEDAILDAATSLVGSGVDLGEREMLLLARGIDASKG